MKKVSTQRDKLLFELDSVKAECPKSDVIDELKNQTGQLEKHLGKLTNQKNRLQMQMSEIKGLIEERETGMETDLFDGAV